MQLSVLKISNEMTIPQSEVLTAILSGGAKPYGPEDFEYDNIIAALTEYTSKDMISRTAGMRGKDLTIAVFKAVIVLSGLTNEVTIANSFVPG